MFLSSPMTPSPFPLPNFSKFSNFSKSSNFSTLSFSSFGTFVTFYESEATTSAVNYSWARDSSFTVATSTLTETTLGDTAFSTLCPIESVTFTFPVVSSDASLSTLWQDTIVTSMEASFTLSASSYITSASTDAFFTTSDTASGIFRPTLE